MLIPLMLEDIRRKLSRNLLSKSRAWVAKVVAARTESGLDRQFLKPIRDYSGANSVGSRGIMKLYLLEPGEIYEVSSPETWQHVDRYFCKVEDGKIKRLTLLEVIECLSENWALTY